MIEGYLTSSQTSSLTEPGFRSSSLFASYCRYALALEERNAKQEAVREAFLWQREINIFIDQSVLYEAETQKAAMPDNAWAEVMASEEASEAAIQNALAALEE